MPQKDPKNALQLVYFDRLNGEVELNSETIPVYDRVPADAVPPYIVLRSFDGINNKTKSSYGSRHTAELLLVTQYASDEGGKKDSGILADQVQRLLIDRENPIDLAPDFHCVTTAYDFDTVSEEPVATGWQVTRLVRIEHRIQQLT